MSLVSFPGLGLNFEFSKIAFTVFGIAVYKYAVCIVLGIVVALCLAFFFCTRNSNFCNYIWNNRSQIILCFI